MTTKARRHETADISHRAAAKPAARVSRERPDDPVPVDIQGCIPVPLPVEATRPCARAWRPQRRVRQPADEPDARLGQGSDGRDALCRDHWDRGAAASWMDDTGTPSPYRAPE